MNSPKIGEEHDLSHPIEPSIFEDSSYSHEKPSSVELSEDKESVAALLNTMKNSDALVKSSESSNKNDKNVPRTQSLFLDQLRVRERKLDLLPKKKVSCAPSMFSKENGMYIHPTIHNSQYTRRCSSLTDINMILKAPDLSPMVNNINRIRLKQEEEVDDSNHDPKDCDEDCSCQMCSCSSCCEDSKCDITNSSMDIHEYSNDTTSSNIKNINSKHQMTLHECK